MMFVFGLILDPLLGTLTIFLGSLFALPMSLLLLFKMSRLLGKKRETREECYSDDVS